MRMRTTFWSFQKLRTELSAIFVIQTPVSLIESKGSFYFLFFYFFKLPQQFAHLSLSLSRLSSHLSLLVKFNWWFRCGVIVAICGGVCAGLAICGSDGFAVGLSFEWVYGLVMWLLSLLGCPCRL